MTNLQKQVLCIMVADFGYDHQPPNGWAPIRHQMLWRWAVEGLHPVTVEAEVSSIKDTMVSNGETFVDYTVRPEFCNSGSEAGVSARVLARIKAIPTREEYLGGQKHKYIQLDNVLAVLESAALGVSPAAQKD